MEKYNDYKPFKHLNNDGRLPKSFTNKRFGAKRMGIDFSLSVFDYCKLMEDANIVSSNIRPNGYHLARYGDAGPYSKNNCRFVPYYINLAEKDMSKTSAVLLKHYKTNPGNFTGKSHSEISKKKIGLANKKMTGKQNSQFGTCWITNGKENTKIRKNSSIPKGWKLGRVLAV